ncbi:hypothetical protein [Acidocella aromatica]|uniref:Uncharacterized protein n=1 Tax=Acidocella aromatica TaxID=1303579 RepID=A0A840VDI8_9PROT|nr:hypothetical protein [Acidocella aromatica]MBB5373923.1 hypothetical protein [Acidocella aromatica]
MSRYARFFCLAALALPVAAPALAQSSYSPSSGEVSHQFSSGANRVGQGATQIGEGIKNGAIMTWDAMKNSAHAFANSFSGDQSDTSHYNSSAQ